MNAGSLFTGYAGLDLAVEAVFGARTLWHSEIDPAASRVLEHHYPDVPNLGDITTIDWSTVDPVDIFGGGFPCQDISPAGKRAGLRPGTRSGLWTQMAYAIDRLRPRYVVAENVRGLLSAEAHSDVEPCPWCLGDGESEPALRALGAVLADLAELGYDARWCGLRAADVGAPHGRFRVFILATDTRRECREWGPAAFDRGAGEWPASGEHQRPPEDVATTDSAAGRLIKPRCIPPSATEGVVLETWRGVGRDRDTHAVADTDRPGSQGPEPTGRHVMPAGRAAADPAGDGRHKGRPEPTGQLRRPDAPQRRATPADTDRDGLARIRREQPERRDADRRGGPDIAWGAYEPAIRRWEHVLGRIAPAPTEPGPKGAQRLSPRFVEWMMGLPAGWVTDIPSITRNDQLRMLGNGVVPQQAIAALQLLTERKR